ncbi:hypothetical protein CYLTODRAFT_421640 [Cylindrobasidium torrendii FP15055 ss-10]|uniref:Wax synthase domain-containing protein n=1 Tax=Cylindrobasidium torrendii FP15055 ss-10 TaxID=1314674 RepID=A0A0D7BFN0_9AGAR|nr:hypothetical protein CYLTODRAFT_421640 [Cylindrobasidium torrendii FP15055 ss-10]
MADTAERPMFKPLYHLILPNFLVVLVLACDVGLAGRIAFFVAFSATTYAGLHSTTGDILNDYDLGIAFTLQWFTAIHFLLLARPLHDFRHKRDAVPAKDRSLGYRLYWCACAWISVRGVGWNFQLKSVSEDKQKYRNPTSFIVHCLWRVISCALLFDLAQTYMSFHPTVFSYDATDSVAYHGPFWRFLNITVPAFNVFCGLGMPYYLAATLHVASGLGKPEDWPNLYGSLADIYSIRTFWAKFWHQLMSRSFITLGKQAVKALKLKQKTWVSYLTMLIVGFGVSGMIHAGADYMAGTEHFGNSFPFFMYQAVGIAGEQLVIHLASRVGLRDSRSWRALGYVWVLMWFNITAVRFMDWGIHVGFFYKDVLPFSPARSLLALFTR